MKTARIKQTGKFLLRSVNQLLWPAACANCSEPAAETDNGLCPQCWEELMQTLSGDYCPSCGVDVSTYALVNNKCPRCLSTEFAFDRIARVAVYDGTMRSLILRF